MHPDFELADKSSLDKAMFVSSDRPRVVSSVNSLGDQVNIAVIPVHGSLEHREMSHYAGCYTGYGFISALFTSAINDDNIDGIAFDLNSGGGNVHGAFEIADLIYSNRGKKSVVSIVDAVAYSSGYLIASQTDKIYVSLSGGVGSIGVKIVHADVSKMYDDMGVKVTEMYAGEFKTLGSRMKPLSDGDKAVFQESLESVYTRFIDCVARGRGVDASIIRDTKAACFEDGKGLDVGLVDAVMSPSEAYSAFSLSLVKDTVGGINMTDKVEDKVAKKDDQSQSLDANALMADGAGKERERISGILACEEAGGKLKLANHLAFSTSMSAVEAKAMLSVAAPEVVVAKEDGQAASMNAFESAMSSDNPNISASSGDGAGENQMTKAQSILADFSAVTGFKSGAA